MKNFFPFLVVVVVVAAVAVAVAHMTHGLSSPMYSLRCFHSLRFVANRMSAIHDYTSIRLYSSLTAHHQIRTHNTVNNRADVDNNQTLQDTQRCLMTLTLLDSHPTIVLSLTVDETELVLDALQQKEKKKEKG